MTRQELDAALARLGLDVPAKERDEIAAAAHYIADMAARLRPPGGRNVAAEPAHVVKFPEGCAMVPDFLTIAEAARLMQQRELSPIELVDSRLARIEKLDGRLHSF